MIRFDLIYDNRKLKDRIFKCIFQNIILNWVEESSAIRGIDLILYICLWNKMIYYYYDWMNFVYLIFDSTVICLP